MGVGFKGITVSKLAQQRPKYPLQASLMGVKEFWRELQMRSSNKHLQWHCQDGAFL